MHFRILCHLFGEITSYLHVCVSVYLEIVSVVQREAIGLQSDSFALFSGDAVDALVVVIVVGGEVWREENTFRSQ